MIGLKIENRSAFLDLMLAQARMREKIRTDVRELTREYRAKLVAAIRAQKSGRRYARRSNRLVRGRVRTAIQVFGGQNRTVRRVQRRMVATSTYTASAPGQAPASLTGTLIRSLRSKAWNRKGDVGATVFADRGTAFYRHFLEFGTEGASRRGSVSRLRMGRAAVTRSRIGKGGIDPRPLFSPMQDQLSRDLRARVERVAAAFAAGR